LHKFLSESASTFSDFVFMILKVVKSASKTIGVVLKSFLYTKNRIVTEMNRSFCIEKAIAAGNLTIEVQSLPNKLGKEGELCNFEVKNDVCSTSGGCCSRENCVPISFEEQQSVMATIIHDMMNINSDVTSSENTHLSQPFSISMMDAHCHLQLDPLYLHYHQHVENALLCGVSHMSVCGTCPGQDWARVEEIYHTYPQMVVPSFGLHPWWIRQHFDSVASNCHSTTQDHTEDVNNLTSSTNNAESANSISTVSWESQLERLLRLVPSAGVGECGLDKGRRKDVDWETQERVLRAHLLLAERYSRPITLHCVGAWGRLLDVLTSHFSPSRRTSSSREIRGENVIPAVILHSCNSMPPEMLPRFSRLPVSVFFSLSGGGSLDRSLALARLIPLSALLVETDSPDQLSVALRDRGLTHNQPCLVRVNCDTFADSMGVDRACLAETVSGNARRAYGLEKKEVKKGDKL
jgi:TatD DNase family protein